MSMLASLSHAWWELSPSVHKVSNGSKKRQPGAESWELIILTPRPKSPQATVRGSARCFLVRCSSAQGAIFKNKNSSTHRLILRYNWFGNSDFAYSRNIFLKLCCHKVRNLRNYIKAARPFWNHILVVTLIPTIHTAVYILCVFSLCLRIFYQDWEHAVYTSLLQTGLHWRI